MPLVVFLCILILRPYLLVYCSININFNGPKRNKLSVVTKYFRMFSHRKFGQYAQLILSLFTFGNVIIMHSHVRLQPEKLKNKKRRKKKEIFTVMNTKMEMNNTIKQTPYE